MASEGVMIVESRETLADAEITEDMTRNRPGNQQYLLQDEGATVFYSPVLLRGLTYERVIRPVVGEGTGINVLHAACTDTFSYRPMCIKHSVSCIGRAHNAICTLHIKCFTNTPHVS